MTADRTPRILLAPNAYKGTLSAVQAAEAMAAGVERALPDAQIVRHPVADGGDGTLDVMRDALGGEIVTRVVTGPIADPVEARYGITTQGAIGGKQAIIEMAEAAGLRCVPEDRRDPMTATTFGVGELVRDALDRGVARIMIGLGGSATVDGGAGMAQAVGVKFRLLGGEEHPRGGGRLWELDEVDLAGTDPRIGRVEVIGLADVQNPLTGPDGAARVFAPQKGAGPDEVEKLEKGLARLRKLVVDRYPHLDAEVPGDGAAGGLGYGVRTFLAGRLMPGAESILTLSGFTDSREGADLVITGEGAIDSQTWMGKAVEAVVMHSGPDVTVQEVKAEPAEGEGELDRFRTKARRSITCWVVGGRVEAEVPERYAGWVAVKSLPPWAAGEGADPDERRAAAAKALEESVAQWVADWARERAGD